MSGGEFVHRLEDPVDFGVLPVEAELFGVEWHIINEPEFASPSFEVPSLWVMPVVLFTASPLDIFPELVSALLNFVLSQDVVKHCEPVSVEERLELLGVKVVKVEGGREPFLVVLELAWHEHKLLFFLHLLL